MARVTTLTGEPVALDVVVHPGEMVTFDDFRARHPAPAMALDGYVDGPPRWDASGPWCNLDHHAGVERLATAATCRQVASAVRRGWWEALPERRASAHVNDCDADVCVAVWVLRHPQLVSDPAVEALVLLEDALDVTGGCAAGLVPAECLGPLAWVFQPVTRWRGDPRADTGAAAQLGVVDEVGARIDAWAAGRPGALPASGAYRLVASTAHVVAIVEEGPYARFAVQADGWGCFVSLRHHGGRRVVSVGRTGGDVPVDLTAVWRSLNRAEGCEPGRGDRWGGGDFIGGSPRAAGTALSLGEICAVVEAHWRG
jgi:hypothetical protein